MQLPCPTEWGSVDRVEMRFRGHKGGRMRRGAVLSRERLFVTHWQKLITYWECGEVD